MGVAFFASCSTPKTVLFSHAPEDSDLYMEAKSILVVLKTAEVYELRNFSVRNDSLIGTRIVRRESGAKKSQAKTALALDDISTIQVPYTSKQNDRGFETGFWFAVGAASLGALLTLAILGILQPWD